MYWPKLTHEKINQTIQEALLRNGSYDHESIIGVPGTYLDRETFYEDAPFLNDAPFLSTMIANPNHIGCHTLRKLSKHDIFKGTKEIEMELIRLCSERIFGGYEDAQDGYVASGGTEANIQAMWIYRNYFMQEKGATNDQISTVFSEDSHYSMPKGSNLLNLSSIILKVNKGNRQIDMEDMKQRLTEAKEKGVLHFIVVLNLSTTMFGSVDDIKSITEYLNSSGMSYKLHVDAAFGGFIYPFTCPDNLYSFKNENISSFTVDGHKMLQSPYGTGIFLVRKGLMKYVCTPEASYIPGMDHTLCGSRSGANAVAVWMILMIHGSAGWTFKMQQLVDKTTRLCNTLKELDIKFYRNPYLNIIAIESRFISEVLAEKYHLVADTYGTKAEWYKIVIMPHVKQGILDRFIMDLKGTLHVSMNSK